MAGSIYGTLEGSNIEIGCDGESLTVNGIKMVLKKDIVTSNGVIHLIDQVLMPDSAKQVMELIGKSQSVFSDMVSELGLSAAMQPETEYTILAPLNGAFSDEVMSMDQRLLKIILENHIVKLKVSLSDLYSGQLLETLGGKLLRVFIYRTAVCIENACMVRGSREGSNGVLHLMRSLIQPSETTIYELLLKDGRFKIFLSLMESAGLTDLLKQEGSYTLFAPVDAAFGTLTEEDITLLKSDINVLRVILLYHFSNGVFINGGLEGGVTNLLKTIQGHNLQVLSVNNSIHVNSVEVPDFDLMASNGVVHVVKTILYPQDLPVGREDILILLRRLIKYMQLKFVSGYTYHEIPLTFIKRTITTHVIEKGPNVKVVIGEPSITKVTRVIKGESIVTKVTQVIEEDPNVTKVRRVIGGEPSITEVTQVIEEDPSVTRFTRVIEEDPSVTKVRRVIEEDPSVTKVRRVIGGEPSITEVTQVIEEDPSVTRFTRVIEEDPSVTKVRRVIEEDPSVTKVRRVIGGEPSITEVTQVIEEDPSVTRFTRVIEEDPSVTKVRRVIEEDPSVTKVRRVIEEDLSVTKVRRVIEDPRVTKVRRVIEEDPSVTKVRRVIEEDPNVTKVTRVVEEDPSVQITRVTNGDPSITIIKEMVGGEPGITKIRRVDEGKPSVTKVTRLIETHSASSDGEIDAEGEIKRIMGEDETKVQRFQHGDVDILQDEDIKQITDAITQGGGPGITTITRVIKPGVQVVETEPGLTTFTRVIKKDPQIIKGAPDGETTVTRVVRPELQIIEGPDFSKIVSFKDTPDLLETESERITRIIKEGRYKKRAAIRQPQGSRRRVRLVRHHSRPRQ
ncbi:periostin-like [Sinocyclocheilus grahami]|uniref:periostin-like n=1 Tax=Sinocyclocheilus grahami TaxID=75366 RepID=UPI0007ACF6D9|nr:PREDICTED: periostin-like [Sinocyclocheilus grahami]